MRERGLKSKLKERERCKEGRSREGAWIEIPIVARTGIYIYVAPVRERGLKLFCRHDAVTVNIVAPVRERGLK